MKASVSYSILHDICHDYIHCRSVINPLQDEEELIMLCSKLGISLDTLMNAYKASFEADSGDSLINGSAGYDYYFQEFLKIHIGQMTAQQEMAIHKFANGDITCC